MARVVVGMILPLLARALVAPRAGIRGAAAPRAAVPAWQSALDEIDSAAWRDVRAAVYGSADASAPAHLQRFEAYCEARRTETVGDLLSVDGGRRVLYATEVYPNLTAVPSWDVRGDARLAWLAALEDPATVAALRDEVRKTRRWRETTWVDTYDHDGAYDSGWGMVHLNEGHFPVAEAALAAVAAPLAPRFASVARQRAGTAIHRHADRVPWILTAHLPLAGPRNAYLVVDGNRVPWTPGVATVTDTTFFHSAHNDHATEDALLLHVDFYHPDLDDAEVAALATLHAELDRAEARRKAELRPFVARLESAWHGESAPPC